MTPSEIVSELDKHIVGQQQAKRSVAVALRNRWRRAQVAEPLRTEITPKNILMIGPTGVGKTEIARRLARLANAPFIKVEATKFTEVGYVGRDVDTIIRDLVEIAIKDLRERAMKAVRTRAEDAAEDRILDVLLPPARPVGFGADAAAADESGTRQKFRKKLREGELDDKEIDIELAVAPASMEILTPPGMEELTGQLQSMFQNMGTQRRRSRKMTIREAMRALADEEAARLVNEDEVKQQALAAVEQHGIGHLALAGVDGARAVPRKPLDRWLPSNAAGTAMPPAPPIGSPLHARIASLNRLGDAQDPVETASLWRHLSHWPALLDAVARHPPLLAVSPMLGEWRDRALRWAESAAAGLPQPTLAPADRAALRGLIGSLADITIPKMLPIVLLLDRALESPANSCQGPKP